MPVYWHPTQSRFKHMCPLFHLLHVTYGLTNYKPSSVHNVYSCNIHCNAQLRERQMECFTARFIVNFLSNFENSPIVFWILEFLLSKSVYLHNYINYDLTSHTTYGECVNFIQIIYYFFFKVDSEKIDFWETFHRDFLFILFYFLVKGCR